MMTTYNNEYQKHVWLIFFSKNPRFFFKKVNIKWNFLGPNFDQSKYNGKV